MTSGPILAAFAETGAVHVPGAVPGEVVAAVRAAAERVLRERDELAASGRLAPELADAQLRRFVRLEHLGLPFDPAAELIRPAFRELAREYLGHEPEPDPNSHVRAILARDAGAHLPFHQDQTIMGRPLVNVWIALDPCGREAPGLEVARSARPVLLAPAPPERPRFPVERVRLDEAEVVRAFGAESLWHPELAAGDALLFSGATAHRTYATAGMTGDRMSVELRLL
jgi:Phytanoyl-CoA dioxygenase (PhyH)